ncbi:MAG TPA: hypothetical protein VLJ57_23710 [Burkholderiaceae bacterium]|nr:hypothetical protein [Burkholderiaceae bacterium]
MKKLSTLRHRLARSFSASLAAIVAGCTTTPLPPDSAPGDARAPVRGPVATPDPGPSGSPMPPAAAASPRVSAAHTPRDYRRDGAAHIYALNAHRIFKGQLPPNLYAIGVLQVDLDRQGRVTSLRWMRAPSHAPEVVAEIERTVRQASPFPAPSRMGKVTYTDTWLWHKSGNFQLDTLTEGQL